MKRGCLSHAKPLGELLALVQVPAGEDHVRACLRKPLRRDEAQATRGASDDRDFACQVHVNKPCRLISGRGEDLAPDEGDKGTCHRDDEFQLRCTTEDFGHGCKVARLAAA